ncbi:hypothetical protein GQ457_05G003460 [Hibiscus cannabinus]
MVGTERVATNSPIGKLLDNWEWIHATHGPDVTPIIQHKIHHKVEFADDLLLFCDDSLSQLKNVIRILRGFEIASGLKLNLEKSRLLGINVENDTVVRWASLLHCQSDNFPCQYLGLPLGAAKNSTQLWQPVVEIFKKKLTGWKSKMLSFGGRITLVKSVLSSLPVYYSSIFPMPSSISSLLAQLTARFLWGSIDSKAIHWVSWESMCLPKACGGLGLCDFKLKNRALLNKWLWRFGVEQDSLWRKVIACKYEGNNSSILPLNLSTRNKSWIWRRIISPLSNAGSSAFVQDSSLFQEVITTKKDTHKILWLPPPLGLVKFNVDGAVCGGVGSAGIGGILRDSYNRTLILFSKATGNADATSAELFAIREACFLFQASPWSSSNSLIIECDCSLVVEWFHCSSKAPVIFKQILLECFTICERCSWRVCATSRSCNATADKLAKQGINRVKDMVFTASFLYVLLLAFLQCWWLSYLV